MLRDRDLDVRTEALLYLAHHARIDPVRAHPGAGRLRRLLDPRGDGGVPEPSGAMQNLDAARVILGTMVDEGRGRRAGARRRPPA